jgi:hypothetical protein
MTKIQLKEEVRRVIHQNWDAFASEHPNLARVIDQGLLVEQAMQSIADDPEYRTAMEQSQAVGIGMEALCSFVERFISRFLREII